MKRRFFIAAAVLFCTAAVVYGEPRPAAARGPALAYRAAGTISFANLEKIAQTVAGIAGPGSKDLVLTYTVPRAIRNQGAAVLFGPMRPGAHGVAVCYVEPTISARVAASKHPTDADLDRMKRWTVVYPTTTTMASIRKRMPQAVPDVMNTLRIPPTRQIKRTMWAWFSPDGQWAVLGPSPAMAANAFHFSAKARARPLGQDLAFMQMDAAGARAVFGTDVCAGGIMAVRMSAKGLEIRGSGRLGKVFRKPLPRGAINLAGIPVTAPLFGITTTPSDVKVAEDIFGMAGPEFGAYVRQSLCYVQGAATGYYLDGTGAANTTGLAPAQRLVKVLPEAKLLPSTANAMFCSPTIVMRLCLPKVAAKMMPFDSAKLQVVLRLLRTVRGDGMGVMSWREGAEDKLFIRISRDELWGLSNLWATMLL